MLNAGVTPSADSKNEIVGSLYHVLCFLSANCYQLELRYRDENHLPRPLKSESSSPAKREQSQVWTVCALSGSKEGGCPDFK